VSVGIFFSYDSDTRKSQTHFISVLAGPSRVKLFWRVTKICVYFSERAVMVSG
jgi:hypothetical protein